MVGDGYGCKQGRLRVKKGRFFAASRAANEGIDYFLQIASTMRGEKIFEQFGNLAASKQTR